MPDLPLSLLVPAANMGMIRVDSGPVLYHNFFLDFVSGYTRKITGLSQLAILFPAGH